MFKIFTDMSSDLTKTELQNLGVTQIPISLTIVREDGQVVSYPNRESDSPSPDEFYRLQSSSRQTTTGSSGYHAIADLFRPALKSGYDILYAGITPDMSDGVWSNLHLAKERLGEEFPNRRIEIVNTHSISPGLGLFVHTLANFCKETNATLDQAIEKANDLALRITHLFTVNNYDHLRSSGRVSRFSATIGTILNIKPFMQLPYDGKLEATDKVRGDQKLLVAFANHLAETIINVYGDVWISYGAPSELERANKLAVLIRDRLPNANISLHRIGPIIGAHTGPTVLAVFYFGTYR